MYDYLLASKAGIAANGSQAKDANQTATDQLFIGIGSNR